MPREKTDWSSSLRAARLGWEACPRFSHTMKPDPDEVGGFQYNHKKALDWTMRPNLSSTA
jgi:hypothetical protein